MNRDGWRGDRMTAEHEAAHAVVAVLSGMAVNEVTIAPPKRVRHQEAGHVDIGFPAVPRPTPLSATAYVDTYAAGFAWELQFAPWSIPAGQDAWARAVGDREQFAVLEFADGAARAARILRHPEATAAVLQIADLLQARKSGSVFGTTVERVLLRRRLVPALDESWRAA